MSLEDPFKPFPRPNYGVIHKPLMVNPVPSQKRPGQIIAFIGKQMCFFENGTPVPQTGDPVEVMITRPLHPKNPPDHKWPDAIDYGRLTALLIRVVDPNDHILMAIEGFECSGTMCSTTTHGVPTSGEKSFTQKEAWRLYDNKHYDPIGRSAPWSLTPGRSRIREASNVNAGFTWKQAYQELHPTNVYVERALAEEKSGHMVRIAGLTRVEDLDCAHLVRK